MQVVNDCIRAVQAPLKEAAIWTLVWLLDLHSHLARAGALLQPLAAAAAAWALAPFCAGWRFICSAAAEAKRLLPATRAATKTAAAQTGGTKAAATAKELPTQKAPKQKLGNATAQARRISSPGISEATAAAAKRSRRARRQQMQEQDAAGKRAAETAAPAKTFEDNAELAAAAASVKAEPASAAEHMAQPAEPSKQPAVLLDRPNARVPAAAEVLEGCACVSSSAGGGSTDNTEVRQGVEAQVIARLRLPQRISPCCSVRNTALLIGKSARFGIALRYVVSSTDYDAGGCWGLFCGGCCLCLRTCGPE